MASASGVWAFQAGGQATGQLLAASRGRGNDLHLIHGLNPAAPLTVTPTSRSAGPIAQAVATVGQTTTVTRQ